MILVAQRTEQDSCCRQITRNHKLVLVKGLIDSYLTMDVWTSAESCRAFQRAPMSRTLFWLVTLPLSVPTWLLLIGWSNSLGFLRKLLRSAQLASPSSSQMVVCSGTQTELNMAQLERFMELFNLNEQAVSALIDHQQQLNRIRQETGTLQCELKSADDCAQLMKQCIVDLQNRNARLHGTLADVVLVLDQLACAVQAADVNDMGTLQSQLLEALTCTRRVVTEVDVVEDAVSTEPSPISKMQDLNSAQGTDAGNPRHPTFGSNSALSLTTSLTDTPPNMAKVLSSGSPRRAVVQILGYDV